MHNEAPFINIHTGTEPAREQTESLQTAESKWASIIYVAKVERAATESSSVMQHYDRDKQAVDNLFASISFHLLSYKRYFTAVDCIHLFDVRYNAIN